VSHTEIKVFMFPWWWLVEPEEGSSIFLQNYSIHFQHQVVTIQTQLERDTHFIPETLLCNCFHIPWVLFSKIKCPLFTASTTKKTYFYKTLSFYIRTLLYLTNILPIASLIV